MMNRVVKASLIGALALVGWIAMVDMYAMFVTVLIPLVAPKDTSAGIHVNAEYVITAEWSTAIDADVDLHVIAPDGAEGTDVYYSARQFNGVTLDNDNRGFMDSHHKTIDGLVVDAVAKEMTTIHGKLPGQFDVGLHLFKEHDGDRDMDYRDRDHPVTVTVEVIKLNPVSKTIVSKQVVLTHPRQCLNIASFVLDKQGEYTLVDPPLTPVCEHVLANEQLQDK